MYYYLEYIFQRVGVQQQALSIGHSCMGCLLLYCRTNRQFAVPSFNGSMFGLSRI